MSTIEFEFDMQKTIEAILYIANRLSAPTIRDVVKLIFFADKTSLENYGRFVTGDRYVAMRQGPVPSETYNLLKAGRDTDTYGFKVVHRYHVETLRDADTEEFSDSDIACLDQVIDAFGHFPGWFLVKISHLDDAYKEIWSLGLSQNTPIPVEKIIRQFEESSELLDYLENMHND